MTAVADFISNLQMYRRVADSGPMIGDIDLFVAALQEIVAGGGAPSGPAGGDLGGTYPNPTVVATHLTAPLPVAQGGTALASGTSGGILGFTAAGVIASSVALGVSQLVLGGGAGATPTALGTLGTTTTVLHGNAAGAPTFGAVSLTADVTGTLPVGNGGTGATAFTQGSIVFAGASGVYTQDNANLFWDDTNNRLGLRTTAPTHPLTLSSSATNGLTLYNTADQTTDFERATFGWVTNVATLQTEIGGTGVGRNLSLKTPGTSSLSINGVATGTQFILIAGATTADTAIQAISTPSNTSGISTALQLAPIVNQSSTGGYDVLKISVTQVGTGSGAKNLINALVGASVKFKVDNTGLITTGSATLIASNVALTNNAGASAGTLTNAPAVGNPTKWIPINDNGTTRNIPAW